MVKSNFKNMTNDMNLLEKFVHWEVEAANFGFRWSHPHQVLKQIKGELQEITDVLYHPEKRAHLGEEIGDLLHAVLSLTHFCKFDATKILESSINKFVRRFEAVKRLAQSQGFSTLEGQSHEVLMQFWDKAKHEVG